MLPLIFTGFWITTMPAEISIQYYIFQWHFDYLLTIPPVIQHWWSAHNFTRCVYSHIVYILFTSSSLIWGIYTVNNSFISSYLRKKQSCHAVSHKHWFTCCYAHCICHIVVNIHITSYQLITYLGCLVHSLVCQGTRSGHNTNTALFMDGARHDTDLALPWSNDTGAVRT